MVRWVAICMVGLCGSACGPKKGEPPKVTLAAAQLGDTVERLALAVSCLDVRSVLGEQEVVLGLRSLADVLGSMEVTRPGLIGTVKNIRTRADELATFVSGEQAAKPDNAELVSAALVAAVQGLEATMQQGTTAQDMNGASETAALGVSQTALADARTAIAALEARTPLFLQQPELHRAFCEVLQAVAALGAVGVPSSGKNASQPERQTLLRWARCVQAQSVELSDKSVVGDSAPAVVVSELRALVTRLSTAPWDQAYSTIAETLQTLARAFEHSLSGSSAADNQLRTMRSSAAQVDQADVLSLDRVGALQQGLGAALVILSQLDSAPAQAQDWVSSAQAATQAIDASMPFGLQRAAIQDSFRSIVDAYAAVVLLMKSQGAS